MNNNEDRHIILNRIQTPDGTILISYHRHDYKEYTDKNGRTYMVDGGPAYLRRNLNDYKELSVFSDANFEEIRKSMYWGTRGKGGREPLRWVLLKDLTTNHINAIIETQWQLPSWRIELFKKELEYRGDNKNNETILIKTMGGKSLK